MKKIALASAAMGGVALIAFGASGTFASFTDTGNLTSEAGAGTLVLNASSPSATARVDAMSLRPGESAKYAYFIKNAGNLPGTVDLSVAVTDAADTCNTQSERDVDSDCASAPGDFSRLATASVAYIGGVTKAADCTITAGPAAWTSPSGQLGQANGVRVDAYPLAAGASGCVVLTVKLPDTQSIADNAVQGDSASANVKVTLNQDNSAL